MFVCPNQIKTQSCNQITLNNGPANLLFEKFIKTDTYHQTILLTDPLHGLPSHRVGSLLSMQ